MYKHIATIAAALAVLSLGALTWDQAQAGNGAPGTPSKYNYRSSVHSSITEFSSSSAKTSGPRR